MTEQAGFPLPSQIADVPGAENWRSMYRYFTRFQPEDDKRFWFYNSMHFPEPMPAFDTITGEVPYQAIGANTARLFVFPTTLGIEHRIVNGRVYITANPVLDPAEIERRAAEFGPRAGYYFENWDSLYEGWKDRLRALIAEIESIAVPALPEWEDSEAVFRPAGVSQNHYLQENFHRVLALYSKMWHHHTEMLMLGYGAYVVFFQFCQQAFPEISDQTVARMVAGIDVIMYRPDDELKGLAVLAVELGLDDLFTEGCVAADVLTALESHGTAGERWLDALDKARDPWFHVSSGDGFYHHHLSWNDDLTVPFTALPGYVAAARGGGIRPRPTEQLIAERERIAVRLPRPAADVRRAGGVRPDAGAVQAGLPVRRGPQVLLRALVHHAVLPEGQGVRGAAGAVLGHRVGRRRLPPASHRGRRGPGGPLAGLGGRLPPLGGPHFRPMIAERKRMLKVLEDWSPPPALGPVPEALNDPAVRMLWGITSERIAAWLNPDPDEVVGVAASAGIVEGIARVLHEVSEISSLREGEILVVPVTAPSWAPVFAKIRAAVSDIGGSMSHAAIVAREYGMPAVVGCGDATKRIRTGDRVRVDGDRGTVRVLE